MPVWQQAFISLVGIAHPHPDILVFLAPAKTSLGCPAAPGLTRNGYAVAGRVEFEAVIAALQDIAEDLPCDNGRWR